MPALGSPMVRQARRMAAAYRSFPGDRSATPVEEILAWDDARLAAEREGAIGRRELLRRGALAGAGAAAIALAGPRSASAAPASDDARVVVVGAGLAGLTATYRLRTHGIHAVVHEAQERLGGRCYSIRGFFSHGQTAEHGGQYIDSRHRHIRSLAEELHVRLVDTWMQSVPQGERRFRWYDGAFRTDDEVFADYGTLNERLERAYHRIGGYRWNEAGPEAVAFDNLTVTEWLDRHSPGGADALLGIWCRVFMASFFGVDAEEASAINLLEGLVKPYPGADERYRVAGGNDRVVRALERALPDGAIRRGSVLEAIWTRYDGTIGLRFSDRARDVIADRVILALPFTTLRDVDLTGLDLTARRRRAIADLVMGTNSKLNLQFTRSFRSLDWGAGFSSDHPHMVTWDSTWGQVDPDHRHPVLTIYNGGTDGASYPVTVPHAPAPAGVVDDALAHLETGVTGLTAAFNGRAFLDSWVDDPWARGSYAGFGPGQYTDFYGFLREPEGNVFFAGEHTSTHSQGYLNGGVATGERTASQVRATV